MATLNDKIKAVHKAIKAVDEAVNGFYDHNYKHNKEFNQWIFSVHTHYKQPRVSVWKRGLSLDKKEAVDFILNDDGWQILDIGGYADEKSEVEAVFKAWLAHDVDC